MRVRPLQQAGELKEAEASVAFAVSTEPNASLHTIAIGSECSRASAIAPPPKSVKLSANSGEKGMGTSALALAALAVVCMLVGPWGAVASLVVGSFLFTCFIGRVIGWGGGGDDAD